MSAVELVAARYGLETPHPLTPAQNYLQLIGWAFLPGSATDNHVRVVIDSKPFAPVERIEREDVAGLFADEPAAHSSGFKFICYLPFGFYTGQLEISADGDSWQHVCSLAIPVSSHPILGAVEKPAAEGIIATPVRIEGWCFHPEFNVTHIVLQFGNIEIACEYGLPRPDVAVRFPNDSRAARSGFITVENLPRGAGKIKIRATTDCGRIYFIEADQVAQIDSGAYAKPPPPSPLRNLSTQSWSPAAPLTSPVSSEVGVRNILLVLYGDFFANSALHVASFADQLNALGYDAAIAVPTSKATCGALGHVRFVALDFSELDRIQAYFKDGRGPSIVHAWTTRENVRKFTQQVAAKFGSRIFVHLEDNEQEILETHLGRPFHELSALPTGELDALVPEILSHPHRALAFLQNATGVTVIVDRLAEHVPAGKPTAVIWPATDPRDFSPRERDEQLRQSLGLSPGEIVLFYHGNVHRSNSREVRSLYEAVATLNRNGLPTQLIRAGKDYPEFLANGDAWIRPFLIPLGHVRPQYLARLMAVADYFVQPGLPDAFNDYRFPSKLPEFFAIGRPVIVPASNLGNVLRHGEDAWVLPRADATSIADAIATLHANPALREKLSRGALEFSAKHFSWARSTEKLVEFYRSLTDLPPPTSS
jgi:glycosyltransferase involved in cell wall biosynthesis